jgi:hypothetical protein
MANSNTRKRKEQRWRAMEKRCALSYFENLSDEITGKLMDLPHPKLDGKFWNNDPDMPHSLWTYVWWLCQQGYENKARQLVDALPT